MRCTKNRRTGIWGIWNVSTRWKEHGYKLFCCVLISGMIISEKCAERNFENIWGGMFNSQRGRFSKCLFYMLINIWNSLQMWPHSVLAQYIIICMLPLCINHVWFWLFVRSIPTQKHASLFPTKRVIAMQ